MKHILKIEQNYYDNLCSGKKKCEIRHNDRDYQMGDILEFEVDGTLIENIQFKITHIHSGLGMMHGYVLLSVEEAKK